MLAVQLKETMTKRFAWPPDSVYIDCDAMDNKPGTRQEVRTNRETGEQFTANINDEWHVY
eukprot:SAG22_NODE_5564_length_992_cov_1.128779_1_plen_59_part_10